MGCIKTSIKCWNLDSTLSPKYTDWSFSLSKGKFFSQISINKKLLIEFEAFELIIQWNGELTNDHMIKAIRKINAKGIRQGSRKETIMREKDQEMIFRRWCSK